MHPKNVSQCLDHVEENVVPLFGDPDPMTDPRSVNFERALALYTCYSRFAGHEFDAKSRESQEHEMEVAPASAGAH